MSVGLPGIYVEVRGDYSQLQKEIKEARALVTSQAKGMSDALNNALSPTQIKNSVDKMVLSLGTLSRASTTAGKTFDNIGVDLGQLTKNTGLTEKQLTSLQSKLLKTQAANAQQKALKTIATSAGLTTKEVKKLGTQFGLNKTQISKVNAQLNKTNPTFKKTNTLISSMSRKVLALGSVWLGAQGLGALKNVTDEYTLIDSKLNLVTESSEEFSGVYNRLFEISQETGTSFGVNAKAFANLQLQLKDTVPAEQTLQLFEDINKSLVINGSTTQEAESFTLQLKQAMGSGVLAGEEFRAVTEANSYWATQLAKALGTNVAGLRKMSKAQLLTRDVVLDASKKMSKQIDEDFNGIQKTIGRAQAELGNAWKDIIADTNKSAEGTKTVATSISDLATIVHENKDEIVGLFTGILSVAGDTVGAIANITRSVQGWAAVGEGSLDFLQFASMDAKELSEWLNKNPASIREATAEISNLQDKINVLLEKKDGRIGLSDAEEKTLNVYKAQIKQQETLISIARTKAEAEKEAASNIVSVNESVISSEVEVTASAKEEAAKRIKISTDEQTEYLEIQKKALEEKKKLLALETKEAVSQGEQMVDSWQLMHDDKYEVQSRAIDAEIQADGEANAKKEAFQKEFVKISKAATADKVSAFVSGEHTKVTVAGIASSYLERYAIDSATKGLEPIFEALGGQIGAWVALATGQSGADSSVNWQGKLANMAGYLAGAGAAVIAGKAIGDNFHAEGGWIGSNKQGGVITGGSGVADDVFLGFTDGGATRNWGMGGEFVMDKETTAANYDLLEMMRGSKKKMFAEGGEITDAWGPTRDINESGFDTFWDSVISSKGDWWSAVAESIGYYAGTGASMGAGKIIGKNLFANGGVVQDRKFGFGGFFSDVLDPGGVFHDSGSTATTVMDVWAGGDPGTNAILSDLLPLVGGSAGTSYLDQLTGLDSTASVDWGYLWSLARDLPIVGETVKRADKILYPFVRDTLTPGSYPDFGSAEDMLRGAYEGLGSELATWVAYAGLDPVGAGIGGALLGSYETGTDYVPETGAYMLHQGEDVVSVPQKKEQTKVLEDLKQELTSANLKILGYMRTADKLFRKWDKLGLNTVAV